MVEQRYYEFVDGKWCTDSLALADAIVSFAPAIERWIWWARGSMGEAWTLAEAQSAAEQALRDRMGE